MTTRAASVSEALPSPSPGQRSCGIERRKARVRPRHAGTTSRVPAWRGTGLRRAAEGSSDALGGTSVLIVVGVALDTIRQMEAQMLQRSHEGSLKS
jgi:hypothetical protein